MTALYLLWTNRAFAAGLGAGSKVFTLFPWYVVGTLVVGIGYALWIRTAHPDTYAEIGRTTLEEGARALTEPPPSVEEPGPARLGRSRFVDAQRAG